MGGVEESVVWLNQPVGDAIKSLHAAPLSTATHGPPLKQHPRRHINMREREREREEVGGGTAREQTLILIIGVASFLSLHYEVHVFILHMARGRPTRLN